MQFDEPMGPCLVRQVVARVAELLAEQTQLPVSKPEELPEVRVRLEQARAAVVKLLSRSQGPLMLIMTGMGGIGKTTLAKAVFNQLHAMDHTTPCHFLRLDPEGREGGMVEKQQELLRGLTCAPTAYFSTAAEGRQLLGQKLLGRKVLVVVDNVWDGQLEQLLPKNIMDMLGEGSLVLVTSRMSGAAARLAGQQSVREVQVEFLSEEDSYELLCQHAGYSSSNLAADKAALIRTLLGRCGGLPMALEVVGKRLARGGNWQGFVMSIEAALADVYLVVRVDRLEQQRTLFEELQLSWDALEAREKDSLLDIVWFLRGQPWELVGAYCGEGVLERLRSLAFVTRGPGEGRLLQAVKVEVINVHPVIVNFCKMAVRSYEDQRIDLKVEDTGTDAIWEELATVCWCAPPSCSLHPCPPF
jgi:hypothetical protein